MPLDLLETLEIPATAAGGLGDIEDLVCIAMRQLGVAVEGLKGSALLFEKAWKRIVLAVADGHTTEIQAARPRLGAAFEERFRLLKEAYAIATKFQKLGSVDIPAPEVLLPELAGMEGLKAKVLDRWQTGEDLEDLAARDYPLTTADLDRIGPQCKAPASWYAEVFECAGTVPGRKLLDIEKRMPWTPQP